MQLDLQGKTALVTASSGGIGFAIASSLAGEGVRVAVNGRSQKTVDKAMAAIRATLPDADLVPLVTDNSNAEGCERTIATLPNVDFLVNNLGIYEAVGFFDQTDADWLRLFETNILSGVRLSRHYLRPMLDRGHGRVLFISSESAVNPAPEMVHYSATKTMQLSIARSLAELTKKTRVTVNSVLVGPTRTEGVETFIGDVLPGLAFAEAEQKFIADNRPTSLLGRLIDPKEVGDVVAFLCSDRAAAVNGAPVRVDGGVVRSVF